MTEEKTLREQYGVRPFEMYYQPVYNYSFRSVCAFRSELRLNTEMGVLLPAQYRDISLRTKQCEDIALWTLETVAADADRLRNRDVYCEWISMYVPYRLLRKSDFFDTVKKAVEENDIIPKDLCFELPADILNFDPSESLPIIERLREYGVNTMLCDVASAEYPVMRLFEYKSDLVLLDPHVTELMTSRGDEGREFAVPVLETLMSSGAELIASGVDTDEQCAFFAPRCVMSVGKKAGRTKKAGSIRP